MNNFDTLFPNFLSQCAEMNRVLTPIAFVLLAVGIVSSTVTGHRSPSAYLRTIGRTFAFAAVLAYLPTWNNEIASVVDTTVKQTLRADPAGVYAQYQKALAVSKGTSGTGTGSKSWWDLLDAQSIFETAISAVMWLLGFLASVIVFYAYLVQKFILYVGFALAPIFIGFLAVRTLHSIGVAISTRLCRCSVLAVGLGCSFASNFRADRFHDGSKLSRKRRSYRRYRLRASKPDGTRRACALVNLQHDRSTDHYSEGNRYRHPSWSSLVRDRGNSRSSWRDRRRRRSNNLRGCGRRVRLYRRHTCWWNSRNHWRV